jgi:hypothetical protein
MKRAGSVIVAVANEIAPLKLNKKALGKYIMRFKGKSIVFDPVEEETPEAEKWLFASENKKTLNRLKKALKQKSGFHSFEDVKKQLKSKK